MTGEARSLFRTTSVSNFGAADCFLHLCQLVDEVIAARGRLMLAAGCLAVSAVEFVRLAAGAKEGGIILLGGGECVSAMLRAASMPLRAAAAVAEELFRLVSAVWSF